MGDCLSTDSKGVHVPVRVHVCTHVCRYARICVCACAHVVNVCAFVNVHLS